MMQYQILMDKDVAALEGKVNWLIQKGWKPAGGMCMMVDTAVAVVAQAMIKEID